MKVIARILGLFRHDVGDDLFEKLVNAFPEGRGGSHGHAFDAALPLDDERTVRWMALLEHAGYSPWTDRSRPIHKSKEFWLEFIRQYEDSDLASCDLLEVSPRAVCPGEYRQEETGHVKLDVHRLDNSVDFALARYQRYVVPNRVKRRLEVRALSHVLFRPTLLADPHDTEGGAARVIPWPQWGPPWWEITSDYTLPPVSPSMDLRDRHSRPVPHGDRNREYRRQEGLHAYPELHYTRQSLQGLEPFDLARTFECFGGELRWDERTLVASPHFYRVFKELNVETDWVPVRIDG
jgi:hypothetical protein